MPVPVPRHSNPVAHPVIKTSYCGDSQIPNLAHTLPAAPIGPPPSYGTREQWISSLPSWRRTKPRRIWEDDSHLSDKRVKQDFLLGLTAADNASVIKGTHADACIPPFSTLLQAPSQPPAEIQMTSGLAVHHGQWCASSPEKGHDCMMVEDQFRDIRPIGPTYHRQDYERGAFTPIFEDQSPKMTSQDMDSSPLEPLTPFGEFVDRAVATAHSSVDYEALASAGAPHAVGVCVPQCYEETPSYQIASEQPKEPAPAPAPEVVTPSATSDYKKLAEPLSDWIANYVWKVCTTGLSVPSLFSRSSTSSLYPKMPPSHLAASVHSLLLSTLLQPSAVFLAIWYIVRLPVYFGAAELAAEYVKENRFRIALLGTGTDSEAMEASAPFRLIVLGCMLANKWLDDHTFSNKTWHNISNVPIHALNRLESLTLDIFGYDLTVPSRDWSQWLAHVMSYHLSLASPTHPQPISRPSANPYSMIRKSIDEIIKASPANNSSLPQPVFIGLEERKQVKLEQDQAEAADVLEIDLDADGPLREEYLPKRHVSGAGSIRSTRSVHGHGDNTTERDQRSVREVENPLPPPAKWSPAGDEPIHRERNRASGQYVAVQPTVYPVTYPQSLDSGYSHQNWTSGDNYKPQSAYVFNLPVPITQVPYNPYPYVPPLTFSHSRSQSHTYEQENMQLCDHMRSYSQSLFEYRCGDARMTANELTGPEAHPLWIGSGQHSYYGSAFAPLTTNINFQSTWLRT